MKKRIKRVLIGAMLLAVVPVQLPFSSKMAHAAILVTDLSNLQQNTLTAIRTAAQIENQLEQIRNQVRTLSTLPSSTFGPIKSIYENNSRELSGLIADVQGISFDLNQIDGQFNQLYPTGTWDSINRNQYEQYFQNWNRELTEAAKTAMKAQSVVERSRSYNDQAATILDSSSGADGEVRQLQANNQMLGLVSAQLNGLTENLAASSRITATAAAESAQRREAEQAYRNKLMTGYGGQDTTPQPITLAPIKN